MAVSCAREMRVGCVENAGVTYVVGQLRANVLIGIELRAIARQRCDSLSRPHRHQLLELDGARGRRLALPLGRQGLAGEVLFVRVTEEAFVVEPATTWQIGVLS